MYIIVNVHICTRLDIFKLIQSNCIQNCNYYKVHKLHCTLYKLYNMYNTMYKFCTCTCIDKLYNYNVICTIFCNLKLVQFYKLYYNCTLYMYIVHNLTLYKLYNLSLVTYSNWYNVQFVLNVKSRKRG